MPAAAKGPRRARITEAPYQAQVVRLAIMCGWRLHHSRPATLKSGRSVTPITGHAGLPDLVMVRAGTLLFVELKGDGGRIMPAQVAWACDLMPEVAADGRPAPGRLYQHGHVQYMLAFPDDWDALEAAIRPEGWRRDPFGFGYAGPIR